MCKTCKLIKDTDDIIINLEGEIWEAFKDFEGYYKVSNKGRVKSLHRELTLSNGVIITKYSKLLKLKKDEDGYNVVNLKKGENKNYMRRVCRLVCQTFKDNPKNLPQVNHIDCVKDNDDAENLEWVTGAQNQRHRFTKEKTKTGIIGVHEGLRGLYVSTFCVDNIEYILGRSRNIQILQNLYNKTVYNYENFNKLPDMYIASRDRKAKCAIKVPEDIKTKTKEYLKNGIT